MPICILGMHRSGTSMVTRLLNLCGLDLGAEDELVALSANNIKGYWENYEFIKFNEDLLQYLGGTWANPPKLHPGWAKRESLQAFKDRATDLISTFDNYDSWGWKDPRSCLTLEFWQEIIPDLKIVLCIRNPMESIKSLAISQQLQWNDVQPLWSTYHKIIQQSLKKSPYIVTHYASYFYNAKQELSRLVDFLDLKPTTNSFEQAIAFIQNDLHHQEFPDQITHSDFLPDSVVEQYRVLCLEAGSVYQQLAADTAFQQTVLAKALFNYYMSSLPFEQQIMSFEQQIMSLGNQLVANEHKAEVTSTYFKVEVAELHGHLDRTHAAMRALQNQVAGMEASLSWRITRPLRRFKAQVPSLLYWIKRILKFGRRIKLYLPFRDKIKQHRQAQLVTESGLFNAKWYSEQYPDVAQSGLDPLLHYINHGWQEGRNPSEVFNTADYLAANPDVSAAHLNPLLHYLQYGRHEGRRLRLTKNLSKS